MTKYNIPLRVKISDKEFDKLKDKLNRSKYVRDAINAYYGGMAKEVETSKKEVIEELKEEIREEQERFKEKMIKEQNIQEERIMSKINEIYDECDYNLHVLEKENGEYYRLDLEDGTEKNSEEKILEILPTLQRMYFSENGIDYNNLRWLAATIDITTFELKTWVENNMKLLQNATPVFDEEVIKSEPGGIYENFNKEF